MTSSKDPPLTNRAARTRPAWRGLLLQLFTIVILPLSALLVITSFAGLALHQQGMRELAAERDEKTAHAVANSLGVIFQQRLEIVNNLVSDVSRDTSTNEMDRSLSMAVSLFNSPDAAIAYLDPSGHPISIAGDPELLPILDTGQILALARSAPAGKATYQFFPGDAGKVSLMLMLALSDDRSLLGLAIFAPAGLIERTLSQLFGSGAEQDVYVITSDRQVLYQIGEGDPAITLTDHPGVSQALSGQTGSMYDQAGREEHIVAYSPIPPFGWALIIEEPWDTIASRMLRLTESAPLFLIPIIVLALLGLWFSSRLILRPLQSLENQAIELGRGNFKAIEQPVGGIEEIRTLQVELVEMARKVRAAQKGLHDYIGAITQGQEDERQRLARELHDDTLQSLIALKQRLHLIQLKSQSAQPGDEQTEMLQQLQQLAEQNIQDLRRLTRGLRPVYLEELGLTAALEMLGHETDQAYPVEVKFLRTGVERRLSPEAELAIYRIAQEALNNVVKHAQAENAYLQVNFTPEDFRLEISDDGQGFSVAEATAFQAQDGHFGLLGMRERAEMIGALLEIHSQPGVGSQVRLVLKDRPV